MNIKTGEDSMKTDKSCSIRFPGLRRLLFVFLAVTAMGVAQTADSPSVAVRIVSDESDAVLAILAKKQANRPIAGEDWQRLFSSEGYVRLKRREASLQRDFTDEEFKTFVSSDALVCRYPLLQAALDKWKNAEITGAAARALAYLPVGARIRAKIYPVIKPKTNSFVFETTIDPAIFLYLDPETGPEKLENTLAHELHHIGYESSCEAAAPWRSEESRISKNCRTVREWIGAFGEGFAMLAAAGGFYIHPHAVSSAAERDRWDADMKNFNRDLKTVERFFLDILDGKLKAHEIQKTAFSFFGIQGPWYTVGWKMAVTIEKRFGRLKLIECIRDPGTLFLMYNQAAAEYNRSRGGSLAVWSPTLVERITARI